MNSKINIDFNAPAKNPYSVPADYFDTLTERIMQNVPEGKKPRRFFLHPMHWAAAAACVALVWSAYIYVHKTSAIETDTVAVADMEYASEEDYSYAIIGNGDILTYLDENY